MPTYHGSFASGGTWEITVPTHAAPGDVAMVDGLPGEPRGGWSVLGETDQTLQLTRGAHSTGEAAGATYDLVLNKASGRLTVTASIAGRSSGSGSLTLVLHGGPPG